jgi:hypothetical protein
MYSKKINIAIIIKNLKNFQDQLFKSKKPKIIAATLFVVISLFFLLPYLLNNDALKFQITQKINQIPGVNFIIKGDVKIGLLPVPSITINDVLLQNYHPKFSAQEISGESQKVYNLFARSVKIKFPFLKFSSNFAIEEIIFDDAILEIYSENDYSDEAQGKFSEILAKFGKNPVFITQEKSKPKTGVSSRLLSINNFDSPQFNISKIPLVEVKNSKIIFYDLLQKRVITAINFNSRRSLQKLAAKGSFNSEDIISNFKLLAKFNSHLKKNDSVLELSSPVLEMTIKGDFSSDNIGILNSDFKGKIDAEILELSSFYKTYIGGKSVISKKLKRNNNPVKISADINNKFREFSIENIIFDSRIIKGTGSLELDFVDKIPLINIGLKLDKLDLDSIWSGDPVMIAAIKDSFAEAPDENSATLPDDADPALPQFMSEKTADNNLADNSDQQKSILLKKEPASQELNPVNFDFTNKIRNFGLDAEIAIKNVRYLEGEIKDVDLYITVAKEGEILILPMIFKIPGDGIVRVNGVFDNSAGLPKFVGKFNASGKNLKEIFKWFKIQSQNLKFDNLQEYGIYSDILLRPNIVTLNNFYLNLKNGSSEFLGDLKIDNNFKTSRIISRFQSNNFIIDDYFLISEQNAYLSPGTLIKKLLWLNDISADNYLSLKFDRLTYKNEEFFDQSVKLHFGRGYLEVFDLNLKSEKISMTADLAIDISDKQPKFAMNIVADNFYYETKAESSATQDENSLKADFNNYQKNQSRNFLDQFFALPSLEGFDGKVTLNFDNLKLDNLTTQNVKLTAKLKNGNFENSELSCDLYDGRLSYKGLIGIGINKIINGSLEIKEASLKPLLSDLAGINNIDGIANISASITASATKKEEFAARLISEIKFNANTPTVSGYGLDDLIKKMYFPQNYLAELSEPEKILLNKESITIFKQASGSIQINSGKEGKLRINVTAPAINGILSGTIAVENNNSNLLFNTIFLTGVNQRSPINIATNFTGKINQLSQSTNFDQVKQYLGLFSATKILNNTQPVSQNPAAANLNSQNLTRTNPANQNFIRDNSGQLTPGQLNSGQLTPGQLNSGQLPKLQQGF